MTAPNAVVIGASAGAVQALLTILPALPATFPIPVLVVVHVPPDRSNSLTALLQTACAVQVKEAEDKEPTRGGVVYVAPPDYHLLIEKDGALALSMDDLVHYSRPSIDVLFESASDAWGQGLIGVILTGANEDGGAGLAAICRAGGTAIVQDPDEAYASAMPRAALDACPGARVLSIEAVAPYLQRLAVP